MRAVPAGYLSGLALATLILACNETPTANHEHPSFAAGGFTTGFTEGWFDGKTVSFFYQKPFFCGSPAEDGLPIGSSSGCEIGSDGPDPREGPIPELYVITPLGFTPPASTLQCPIAGNCINHPSTVDLSRLFGPGSANVPLPAHSHIVEEAQGNWWETFVVGVKDLATWNQIVAAKSIDKVEELQAADPSHTHITANIESNIYLFFAVQPGKPLP